MSDMLPRPEPRPGFKRALRAQLMAQAGLLGRRETAWSRFTGGLLRPALRPALAVAVVLLLLVTGTGKAAAGSLPGDAVYGLKRVAEELQLVLALDDTTRLRTLAQQADHRLAELAEAVATRPDKSREAETEYATAVKKLTSAVDAVRSQPNISDDKKTAAEDVVDAAFQKHGEVLNDLEKQVASPSQRAEVEQEIERARTESDKLHASDRPARTPEPSAQPERSRSPQPSRSPRPSATPEHDSHDTPADPARPRTPSPGGERSATPPPVDR
jgi:hypothetical protein